MKTPKTAEEWQRQIGFRTVTNALNPFGYDVPRVSLEIIKSIQLNARICALHEAAGIVEIEMNRRNIVWSGLAAKQVILSHAETLTDGRNEK